MKRGADIMNQGQMRIDEASSSTTSSSFKGDDDDTKSPHDDHQPPSSSSWSSPSPTTTTRQQQQQHRCKHPVPYLILTNISKRQNVKNLLQLAAAYGCPTVFVVGQKAFEFDPDAPGGNTDIPPAIQQGVREGKMKIVKFQKLEECARYVKSMPCCEETELKMMAGGDGLALSGDENAAEIATSAMSVEPTVPIIGIEIDPSSQNLEDEPFATSTAFMMGNEGSGMTTKQMSICDGFIRISQYGGGTASLNVSVAAGIVLHRFCLWSMGR